MSKFVVETLEGAVIAEAVNATVFRDGSLVLEDNSGLVVAYAAGTWRTVRRLP